MEIIFAHKKGHRCDTGAAGKRETQWRGDCLVSNLGGRTLPTRSEEGEKRREGGKGETLPDGARLPDSTGGKFSERPRLAYSLEGGLVRLLLSEYWLSSHRLERCQRLD